jgi:hypothetical protein
MVDARLTGSIGFEEPVEVSVTAESLERIGFEFRKAMDERFESVARPSASFDEPVFLHGVGRLDRGQLGLDLQWETDAYETAHACADGGEDGAGGSSPPGAMPGGSGAEGAPGVDAEEDPSTPPGEGDITPYPGSADPGAADDSTTECGPGGSPVSYGRDSEVICDAELGL